MEVGGVTLSRLMPPSSPSILRPPRGAGGARSASWQRGYRITTRDRAFPWTPGASWVNPVSPTTCDDTPWRFSYLLRTTRCRSTLEGWTAERGGPGSRFQRSGFTERRR
ncbi:hypothetical protein DPEC_G00274500 [Dallia pectoralis]|uniref:Uncharacterized protein n=1 Tax=Dallia pectoralis TaxID=75939 RepID=A0ACC2FLD2_DALPE|nr:hypothetical protein DPEC_G00274500 [Dallia pectoralis]